jgi:LPXTG-site transpeptidase (sortase) family protein
MKTAADRQPRRKMGPHFDRDLAARLRESQAEANRLRQREAHLTEQVESAQASLQDARTEIQLRSAQIEDLQHEVERLRKAEADRKILDDRLRSVRRQLAEEAAKLEVARREAENARIQLDGMAQIRAERERQLEELGSKTERLSDEIEEKRAQNKALDRTLQEAREEARALKEVRERLELARADRDALEDSLDALEENLAGKAKDLQSTQVSLKAAQQELQGINDRRAEQELKLDELNARNQTLDADVQSKESALEALESRIADVREELKELRRERARVSEPLDGQLAQVVEDAVQSGLSGVPSLFGKSDASSAPVPNLMMIILVGIGILLLLVGSILAYPHIVSRLWGLSDVLGAAPVGQAAPASSAAALEPPEERTTATALASADADSQGQQSGSLELSDTLEPTATPPGTTADTADPTPLSDGTLTDDPDPPIEADPAEEPTATPTPLPAIPTRIVIPRLNLDAPVVPVGWSTQQVGDEEMGIWEVPNEPAAGWHDESAPLGQVGNTVLNGHNTTYGEVFRDLYRLDEDDVITLHAGDAAQRYRVAQTTIFRETGQPLDVRLEHAELLGPTEDERLTLITCHPYGSTANRLVITAFPESAPTEDRFGG